MSDNQTTEEDDPVWHEPRHFEERFLIGVLSLFAQKYGQLEYYWSREPNTSPASFIIRLRRSMGLYPSDEDMRFYGARWS